MPSRAIGGGNPRGRSSQVLSAFQATVRDEVDFQRLTESLLAAVRQAMQPEAVSLWAPPAPRRLPVAAEPADQRLA